MTDPTPTAAHYVRTMPADTEPTRVPTVTLDQADYDRLCATEAAHQRLRAGVRGVIDDVRGHDGLPMHWKNETILRLHALL